MHWSLSLKKQQKFRKLESKYNKLRAEADEILDERNDFADLAELLEVEVSPERLAHVKAFLRLDDGSGSGIYFTLEQTRAKRAHAVKSTGSSKSNLQDESREHA